MGRSGEADFRGWVEGRRTALRSTAFLLCGDWYLADDLVQEACTRVYAVWDRVSASGSPDAYARRVLVNLYLDHRRRPSRREHVVELLPDAPAAERPDGGAAGDAVVEALATLPPGQRAVLVLRFWEGLTLEESAAALGSSVGNVKAQSSRAYAALRSALVDRGLHGLAETVEERA